MKSISLTIMLLSLLNSCSAQIVQTAKKHECRMTYESALKMTVYTFVDQMPAYAKEGEIGLLKFFNKNLHISDVEENPQRSLFLTFVVTENGKIIDSSINGKNKNEWSDMDKEGLRVLSVMPPWNPGKCNGVKVPVRVSLPIYF